jgi:hypothetical protein
VSALAEMQAATKAGALKMEKSQTMKVGVSTVQVLKTNPIMLLDELNTIYCLSETVEKALQFKSEHHYGAFLRVEHRDDFIIEVAF